MIASHGTSKSRIHAGGQMVDLLFERTIQRSNSRCGKNRCRPKSSTRAHRHLPSLQ